MKNSIISMSHSALYLYAEVCKPVCEELEIPQTAFDILMFLSNYPQWNTAREITKFGGIKKNLVSMHVERLVAQGYVVREAVPGDRRQIRLEVTDKARAVVEKGHRVQKFYYEYLMKGLTHEEIEAYEKCMRTVSENMDALHEELKKNLGETL